MIPVKFKGYGVSSSEICVNVERIVTWWPIDYDGNYGTEIRLDTGNTIRIGEFLSDATDKINAAIAESEKEK